MKFNQLIQTLCCELRSDSVLVIALRAGLGSVHLVQMLFTEMADRQGWTNRIIARDDGELVYAQKLIAKDNMLENTMVGIAKANMIKQSEAVRKELGIRGLRFMTVQSNFEGVLSEENKIALERSFEDYAIVYVDKNDDGTYTLKYE